MRDAITTTVCTTIIRNFAVIPTDSKYVTGRQWACCCTRAAKYVVVPVSTPILHKKVAQRDSVKTSRTHTRRQVHIQQNKEKINSTLLSIIQQQQ